MWLANGHTALGFHGRVHGWRQRVACGLRRVHHSGNGGCGVDASYRRHGDQCCLGGGNDCSHCGDNYTIGNHLIDNHHCCRGICYVDHPIDNHHRGIDDITKRDPHDRRGGERLPGHPEQYREE